VPSDSRGIWQEAVKVLCKVPYWHLHTRIQQNHKKSVRVASPCWVSKCFLNMSHILKQSSFIVTNGRLFYRREPNRTKPLAILAKQVMFYMEDRTRF
jgi:hypothetical protein